IDPIDSLWFSGVADLKHFVIVDVSTRCHRAFTSGSHHTAATAPAVDGFLCVFVPAWLMLI
ncbi:MAG TPA: hypothetical protein VJM50_08395, partial [Pyrinomonadaceae bacterium]|nr:hypothetical protein [Pyrinomonadaceae bacterium]